MLVLFYVLVFWLGSMWNLSSLTRDQTHTLCVERWSLNHWTVGEVPQTFCTHHCLCFPSQPGRRALSHYSPQILSHLSPHPESESRSVISDSLRPHGLYSPWNSPGQNIEVGSLSLLQGVFLTQGLKPSFPHFRQILVKPRNEHYLCELASVYHVMLSYHILLPHKLTLLTCP